VKILKPALVLLTAEKASCGEGVGAGLKLFSYFRVASRVRAVSVARDPFGNNLLAHEAAQERTTATNDPSAFTSAVPDVTIST
jgi:hypothetical protein